jgi:preprotein translocase subunit SecG
MYFVFSILIVIVGVLLVLIVLVQNSKGGGLASGFASSNQFMGVRKTADFLEKATWTLAACLLLFCLLATISLPRESKSSKSLIEEQVKNAVDLNTVPNFNQATPNKPSPAPGAKPNAGKFTMPKTKNP